MSKSPSFLKHSIVVFRFFRDVLDYIPVFHDLSFFDPENVHGRLAAVLGIQFDVVVDENQIPIRTHVFDFRAAFREFLQESGDPFLKSLFPVFEARVVLDIVVVRQLVNDFRMVFIENLVPEISSQLLVAFEMGGGACNARQHPAQQQSQGQGE